jgi:cytochrome c-type biogenesis protein CcmE
MDKRKIKFLAGSLVIVLAVAWLGFSSFDESVAYYKTVGELQAMGDEAYGRRIRVAGNVVPGSILRADQGVRFTLEQEGHSLNIRYVGKDLLPDTFKDDAQAMAEGKLMPGGEFQSTVVQAKCASKYEATYSQEALKQAAGQKQ